MKNLLKGKIGTVLILAVTVILAGVAIFTAIRLYQLGNQPVAPNVPSSIPRAAENNACSLTFTVGTPPACVPHAFVTGSIIAGDNNTTNVSCDFGVGLDCLSATVTINGTTTNCTYTNNVNTASVFSCSVPYTPGMKASCISSTNITFPTSKSNCCSSANLLTAGAAIVCSSKTAYKDVSTNSAGTYDISDANLLPNNATVTPGQKIVFVVNIQPASVTKSITVTDVLPDYFTYLDGDTGCTYASANKTVTCTLAGTGAGGTQRAFRVTVAADATGTLTNTANVQGQGDTLSTCSTSLAVQVATASPTSSPTASPTSSPGPSGTPNSCNGTCGSDANCLSGYYFCYQGYCRDRSCPNQTDCTCPGTTAPTPSPTGTRIISTATPAAALPSSGTDWPTVAGAGIGVFVIIGSLLLAI